MKKILFLIIAIFLYGSEFVPYTGYISYSKDSNKTDSSIIGSYIKIENGKYQYEFDVSYLSQTYDDGDYNEIDLTAVWNMFDNDYKYRVGIHNIYSISSTTATLTSRNRYSSQTTYSDDYSFVIFGGIMKYKYLLYNRSIDLYYSHYKDIDAIQISPKAGYNINYSGIGSFYIEGKVNFIYLTKSVPKDNYTNLVLKLQYFKKDITTTLRAKFFKSVYEVDNDGFVVYNLGEEYKNSYSINISKTIDNSYISVGYGYSKFVENGVDCSSSSYSFSVINKF